MNCHKRAQGNTKDSNLWKLTKDILSFAPLAPFRGHPIQLVCLPINPNPFANQGMHMYKENAAKLIEKANSVARFPCQ